MTAPTPQPGDRGEVEVSFPDGPRMVLAKRKIVEVNHLEGFTGIYDFGLVPQVDGFVIKKRPVVRWVATPASAHRPILEWIRNHGSSIGFFTFGAVIALLGLGAIS